MDAQKSPDDNVPDVVRPAMAGKNSARWSLILLVLCAVGAVLVIGILALQVAEYSFYKAAPNVWPQPGAGGMAGVPEVMPAPAAVTAPSETAASPVPVSSAATAVPSETATPAVPTVEPAAAAASAPAPVVTAP